MTTANELREKARSYRDMVNRVTDGRLIDALLSLADEYDERAAQLEEEDEPG